MGTPLLTIKNLSVQFDKQNATAVDDISFTLEAGERFYIAFGADNLPTGFALNVTLTPVA